MTGYIVVTGAFSLPRTRHHQKRLRQENSYVPFPDHDVDFVMKRALRASFRQMQTHRLSSYSRDFRESWSVIVVPEIVLRRHVYKTENSAFAQTAVLFFH